MQVNLLNERISLLKMKLVTDEIGNHTNEWREIYSCFATISHESPQESTDHGVVYDDSKIDFTIRYSSEVASIQSTNYRVKFKGDFYSILGIDHMNYQKKCLKLHCQRIER
ncbi:phage head closure protein [Aerococcaceae bacterium NML160702]|nr:phage head closure protein [Aerococcaceae bacterium NML160702]